MCKNIKGKVYECDTIIMLSDFIIELLDWKEKTLKARNKTICWIPVFCDTHSDTDKSKNIYFHLGK